MSRIPIATATIADNAPATAPAIVLRRDDRRAWSYTGSGGSGSRTLVGDVASMNISA